MAQFAKDRPFVAAAKFDIIASALDDGTSAYGSWVGAASGSWVLGSTLLGRRIEVTTINGALTGTPTALKIGLLVADADTGSGGALVTGTDTEFTSPAAATKHMCEISLAKASIDTTKYYSVGAALNGTGSTALTISTISRFLDPPMAS